MRPRLHHMSLCIEGVCYLIIMGFILAAALIRQINLLMVLYGILAGPLLLSWPLVRRQVKRIDVVRRVPKSVVAGTPFTVELEIRNERRGAAFALAICDELERRRRDGEGAIAADVYCPYLEGGSSRQVTYQGRLARRGIYSFQPLKLSSRFPLGLLRTMVRIDKPMRLTVLPRLGRLSPEWRRLLRAEEGGAAGSQRRAGAQDGDFYGLRDWRPGDPKNRIHWRTSARRQALTVRQYERRRQSELLLIVELWEPAKPTDADRARTEAVASFAATVLVEASREGGQFVRLELIGRKPRSWQGTAAAGRADEAWHLLAALDATDADHLPRVLVEALSEPKPPQNVVILSTRSMQRGDRERFAALYARPELQSRLQNALAFAPDEAAWSEFFHEAAP